MEEEIKTCEHKILIKTGEGQVSTDKEITEKWNDYQCSHCLKSFKIIIIEEKKKNSLS